MSIGLISNQQTFIDLTDAKNLEVSIASNLPTVQIKDNSKEHATYSPSWDITNLILTPTVFLNSHTISLSECSIIWKRQDGASTAVNLMAGETVSNGILTVNTNNLSASSSGIITYICTVTTADDIIATASISFSLITSGTTSTSDNASVTFQLYAPNGYILSNSMESLELNTSAYVGSTQIGLGEATYKWYAQSDTNWELIQDGTASSYVVTRSFVNQFKNFKCDMLYKGNTYTSTILVEDKGDIYNSVICISNNLNAINGRYYWIMYTLVYNQYGEIDPLYGPISTNAPESPLENDYWYAIDETNLTINLKKFDGNAWIDTSDTQQLDYCWSAIESGSTNIAIGDLNKVQMLSAHDFTATVTLLCEVMSEDGILTKSTLSLTDTSDPIVSDSAPQNAKHGQIWIKKNDDGSFLMFVWDNIVQTWVTSDADTHSRVYTSRPSVYNAGDLWITSSDDDHSAYLQGTLLQAKSSNTVYDASDWSPTLKYDKDIESVKSQLDNLSQYVTINSDGLRIGAKDANGVYSPFTSLFTSEELAFYQNSDKLLTLANNKLTAPSVEVENNLHVDGSISLDALRLVVEDNGSFSFSVFS